MARVFPMEDWAPTQESRASFHALPNTPELPSTHPSPSSSPFRKRLQSLPLVGRDDDISEGVQRLSVTADAVEGETKKVGGFRGLIRRASQSIKARRYSNSSEIEERPQRSWQRLKTAASFNRHSKYLSAGSDPNTSIDSQDDTSSGAYKNPTAPLIPFGGHAARFAAAQQNEYLGRMAKGGQLRLPDEQFGDRESGIGIVVTSTSQDTEDLSEESDSDDISRVDFISALPTELAMHILACLDQETLRSTALVCRQWCRISQTQSIWRDVFIREQTKTYATSKPLAFGVGLGLPEARADNDWKDLYRIKEQLKHNWLGGTAEAVYLNGHQDSIYCVQFDENKIVTGSRDKTIRIWNMQTYKCDLIIGPPDVISSPYIIHGEDGHLVHYATMPDLSRSAACIPSTISFPIHHNQSILCLQYDEKILVTGSSDSTCIVYDVENGYKPIRRLRHHSAAVLDLAFDAHHIVTCSKDISICVWDRETGALLKQLRGHVGPVNAVQLRGNTIVSCSGDFKVKLWNIDTGKNFRELPGHTKGLACSQFSDDSRFIASAGNDKIIRIWDANTGECLKNIAAHENLVRSLHIDSVSGRLISGSYDQDIKVFDMASGALLLDFPKWHSSWVLGAKSDYRRIISTGQDPKILIMDFGMSVRGIEKLESKRASGLNNSTDLRTPYGPGSRGMR